MAMVTIFALAGVQALSASRTLALIQGTCARGLMGGAIVL